jgi:hypothetical protein
VLLHGRGPRGLDPGAKVADTGVEPINGRAQPLMSSIGYPSPRTTGTQEEQLAVPAESLTQSISGPSSEQVDGDVRERRKAWNTRLWSPLSVPAPNTPWASALDGPRHVGHWGFRPRIWVEGSTFGVGRSPDRSFGKKPVKSHTGPRGHPTGGADETWRDLGAQQTTRLLEGALARSRVSLMFLKGRTAG